MADEHGQTNLPALDFRNLKHHNYAASLVEEGCRCGLLDDGDRQRVSEGLSDILERQIELLSGGESTSVLTETAVSLASSALFAIDSHLLSFPNPREAILELKNRTVPDLYDLGRRRLRLYQFDAASMLVKARRNRLTTPNRHYNSTVDRQLKKALSSYNISLAAHVSGRFDYPLALPCTNVRGIYYLKAYITSLYCENLFCKNYDIREISLLYKRWRDVNVVGVDDADVNIYSLVFMNALFCDYLKKEHGALALSRADCELAARLLEPFEDEEKLELLHAVMVRFSCGDPDYNERYFKSVSKTILNALRNGALGGLLTLLPKEAPRDI